MSDDKKDIIDISKIDTDLSYKEEKELQEFIKEDMPGLSSVEDTTIGGMLSMYMKGKSYSELSSHFSTKKKIVLFIAKQNDWYIKKTEYLTTIQDNIQSRLTQTKIESINFLTDIVGAYHKIMAEKLAEGMASGKRPSEFLEPKEMQTYFKALDAIDKAIPKQLDSNAPSPMTVNIHGDSKTKVSEDGKTLEIESGGNAGNVLKELARLVKANKKD